MAAALTPDMLATDLAEYLVRKGMIPEVLQAGRDVPLTRKQAFHSEKTHHIAGRVVALAEKEDIPMDKLSIKQLKGIDANIGDDVVKTFDYERSVEMKSAVGGTSKSSVIDQIRILRNFISGW